MPNDPQQSQSDSTSSTVKRQIKIGTQRHGELDQIRPSTVGAQPAMDLEMVAATVAPTSETHDVATPAVDSAEAADANQPAATSQMAIGVGEEGANVPEPTAAAKPAEGFKMVGPQPVARPNLRRPDADLEREIAQAMGADIDDLLSGQLKSGARDEEIKVESHYRATVLKVYRDSVIFELPGQQNGVAPLKQFETPPEVGSELEVVVIGISASDQMFELSVPGASVAVADWSDLAEGLIVEAKITGHNKGGLECEVNHIRGFMPASQVSLFRVEDFSTFVGQSLMCVVTEANPDRRNLVLSHRAVLERERAAQREKTLAQLEVGKTLEGIVTRLQNFGAFVDLGGVDGLIHISQLSWDNIGHPREVLEEGQRVRVRIERVDTTTGKIGLGYRDLMHHPWEGIESKFVPGAVVTGTVSKIMDFGAFVKLEPGVEGLVHISELSHKRVTRVSQVVQEGQQVEVKVLGIDSEAQRISLSIKQAIQVPTTEGAAESEAATEPEEPRHQPKRPAKSLKGGTGRDAGGNQFGLKW